MTKPSSASLAARLPRWMLGHLATLVAFVALIEIALWLWPQAFGPGSQTGLVLIGMAGVFLRFALPVAWRLGSAAPQADIAAIRDFLADRDQTLQRLEKMVLGGPTGESGFLQAGRPYRVFAIEPDGSRWMYRLALRGGATSDPVLLQRPHGVWKIAL